MTTIAPLARDRHGAILGPDYRRTDLCAPEYRVPGRVPAHVVMPGDRVVLGGEVFLVEAVREQPADALGPAVVWVTLQTRKGGSVTFELDRGERVDVLSAGAYDR